MANLTKKDKQTILEALWYAQTLIYPDAQLQDEAVERGQKALNKISQNWRTKFYPALTGL